MMNETELIKNLIKRRMAFRYYHSSFIEVINAFDTDFLFLASLVGQGWEVSFINSGNAVEYIELRKRKKGVESE